MALTITIDGAPFTSSLRVDSLSIDGALNERNTASFSLIEEDGAGALVTDLGEFLVTDTGDTLIFGINPDVGQEVIVLDGATRIFAGTIDDIESEKLDGHATAIAFEVACVDYNQLADRHLVARNFDTAGQTLSTIVLSIVAVELAGEGITTAGVQTGPAIDPILWNYESAAQAFDDLSEITGYAWYIDYNKVLHFEERATNAAPFGLTDTSANFRRMKVRKSREDYRNKQLIRAGVGLTDIQTETLATDGKVRAFLTGYPIGTAPTVTLNGVAQTVGIGQIETGKAFYWNEGVQALRQDDAGALLTADDVLIIEYRGQYPITIQVESTAEIASRAAIEGGTGVYEAIEDAPNINGEASAASKAEAMIRKLARIPVAVEFETDEPGLTAGQLMPITNTHLGLSGDWLIESVAGSDLDGLFMRWNVRALDGESLGGWEKFFRDLARMGKQKTQRANEVVGLYRSNADAVIAADLFSHTSGARVASVCGLVTCGFCEVG